MSLFAIGDLHLPGGDQKPMSVFGPEWDRHFFRISEAWREMVTEKDTVLIPGDISWAMRLEEALPDLESIGRLPGRKVLIRGNHDYWWNSISRIRAALPENMTALQHDAADLGSCVVCGTRGWSIPTPDIPLEPEDMKIYLRENARLELALESARKMAAGRPLIVMMHFPPLYGSERRSGFTELMERYAVQTCVYGHLHGMGTRAGFTGLERGIRYCLTSCDYLNFRPLKIS